MQKKFVRVNEFGKLMEIDPRRLRRAATALRDTILTQVSADHDPFQFRNFTLPFVERVLAGQERLPCDRPSSFESSALRVYEHENGTFPPEFKHLAEPLADFNLCVTGNRLAFFPIEIVNGDRFVWEEYEEEGDWPELVMQRRAYWNEEMMKAVEGR